MKFKKCGPPIQREGTRDRKGSRWSPICLTLLHNCTFQLDPKHFQPCNHAAKKVDWLAATYRWMDDCLDTGMHA